MHDMIDRRVRASPALLRPHSNRRARRSALLRRSGVVGGLLITSGFQVDSAGIGLNCRTAEPGARGCRFHFAERAREVKGQNPR
jgi:hypothetical protein